MIIISTIQIRKCHGLKALKATPESCLVVKSAKVIPNVKLLLLGCLKNIFPDIICWLDLSKMAAFVLLLVYTALNLAPFG